MDKKELEFKCISTTKEYIKSHLNKKERKYINSVIPLVDCNIEKKERPDFVGINDDVEYLIEHFMVDICYDGRNNNQSKSKIANHKVNDIYEKYHDNQLGTIKEKDYVSATRDIETSVNDIINISNSFEYEKYIEGLARTFRAHYDNVDVYKQQGNTEGRYLKIGFLIEFHVDTYLLNSSKNGRVVMFRDAKPKFPVTREVIALFEKATKLDFIIVSQYAVGIPTEAIDVKVYEPRNINRSLKEQQVEVYDMVYYTKIRKDISVKLADK